MEEELITAKEAYPIVKAFALGKLQVEHYDKTQISANTTSLLIRLHGRYRMTVHLDNAEGVDVSRIPSVTTPSKRLYNINLDTSKKRCVWSMLPPAGKKAFRKRLVEMLKEPPELQVEVAEVYRVYFRGSAINSLFDKGTFYVKAKTGGKLTLMFPDKLRHNLFNEREDAQKAAEAFRRYYKASRAEFEASKKKRKK